MQKETKEEFREVFTYENFKRQIVKIQELEGEIKEIKEFIDTIRQKKDEAKND